MVPLPSVPHQSEQVPSPISDGGEPRFHIRRNSGFTANPGPERSWSAPPDSSFMPLRSWYQPHTAQAIMPRRKSLLSLNRPNGVVPWRPAAGTEAPAAASAACWMADWSVGLISERSSSMRQ